MHVAIIGAGIIGTTAAHALLDEGYEVTLVDPGNTEGRACDGNAGWIAHTDIMPLASPKVWRNLPGWLADPLGPLAIRPSYLPRLAPWLMRFVMASSPHRIEASILAIRSLNGEALPAWRRRLDALNLSTHFLRERGNLSIWAKRDALEASKGGIERQQQFGIAVDVLGPSEVRQLEPALAPVAGGAFYPEGCHVADPMNLVSTLRDLAFARGAHRVDAAAEAVLPGEASVRIKTDRGEIVADHVVVAAGAWSRPLAMSLGDRIPLDTERGYNATFPTGFFGLTRPIMYEGEGMVTTPLDTGDRVGGAVEFAGLKARPNHARTDAILARLRRFLPHLPGELPPARRWMGFRPSLPDSLPVIGRARRSPRVIYAFGHAHHGLTQAAATAEQVAALVADRKPSIDLTPFAATRF